MVLALLQIRVMGRSVPSAAGATESARMARACSARRPLIALRLRCARSLHAPITSAERPMPPTVHKQAAHRRAAAVVFAARAARSASQRLLAPRTHVAQCPMAAAERSTVVRAQLKRVRRRLARRTPATTPIRQTDHREPVAQHSAAMDCVAPTDRSARRPVCVAPLRAKRRPVPASAAV